MKTKSLLFGLGAITVVATPIMVVTSCGGTKTSKSSDIGGLDNTFNSVYSAIEEKANEIKSSSNEQEKNVLNQKIMLITSSGGVVNDNSFNQMTWEAVKKYSSLTGVEVAYKETGAGTDTEMAGAFDNALNKGYKIWVLTGWSQETPFKSWYEKNKTKFDEQNIKVVAIDWDATSIVGEGRALSLNFRTQESSFLVGYSVAKFLGTNYKGEENKNKRIVNTTSGADSQGSTNFNYGFLEGIRMWNSEQQESFDTKIATNIYTNDKKVWLETTYVANDPTTKEEFKFSITGGSKVFQGAAPTVVMPVAGDWSKTAADIIKSTGKINQQWVVGVDSNMALAYGSSYASRFITSSEKRIGVATFKAISFLTGITTKVSNDILYLDSTSKNWTINSDGLIQNDSQTPKNLSVVGGISSGFVGASASTLSDAEKAKQFDSIVKESQERFFGDSGELNTKLKPSQELLEAFEKAQKAPGDNNTIYNEAVFNLKNVLFGAMTTGNQGYFNKVAEEINAWLTPIE